MDWNSRAKLNLIFQVVKNNAVTDQEKREKKIVVKKLAEMEEELKVERLNLNTSYFSFFELDIWFYFQLLALSENLTDQVWNFKWF